MIVSGPNITIISGGSYNIPSPIFPQSAQPWQLEISNFSPENLMVISSMGQKLINPYTVDVIGDPYGEMPPTPIFFQVTDPASGIPASTVPYYVSVRWCSWPDSFTHSYPGILQPAVIRTTGFVATSIVRVQNVTAVPSVGSTSINKAFTNPVNVKSTLIMGITWDIASTPTITGVSDNINGAWTLLGTYTSASRNMAFYGVSNSVGGNITVTTTFSVSALNIGLVLAEYANLPTTAITSLGSVGGEQHATACSTLALTTTSNGLLFGLAVTSAGASSTETPGAGWASVASTPGSSTVIGIMLADQGVPNNLAPGGYAFSWTAANTSANTSFMSGIKSS